MTFWVPFSIIVCIDLIFIMLHCSIVVVKWYHKLPGEDVPTLLLIGNSVSIPEFAQFAKWFAISALLGTCALKARDISLGCLSLVFVILLADDALSIHERGGALLAARLGLSPALGLRAQDFGELATWGMLGVGVVSLLTVSFLKRAPSQDPLFERLMVALAGLIIVGIGLDMLHQMIVASVDARQPRAILNLLLMLAEDGGEMILASFALAVVVSFWWQREWSRKGQRSGIPANKRPQRVASTYVRARE